MANKVSFPEIVNRLGVVLSNDKLQSEYKKDAEIFCMFGGWCNGMAPETRPAFIKTFGLAVVEKAESEARAIIESKKNQFLATAYHAHEIVADAHLEAGQPAPSEGGFVWAVSSNMKGENGYKGELQDLMEYYEEEGHKVTPRLCCIEKVIHVESLPLDASNCDKMVPVHGLKGGSRCEDLTPEEEGLGFWQLGKEKQRLFYTIAAAIVDNSGRWYLVDAEGYDYCRYYYSPLAYSQVFAPELGSIRAAIEARKIEEANKEAQERAARLEAYRARCAKWESIMEPVASYLDEYTKAQAAAPLCRRKNASPKELAAIKAARSAEIKLNNCRRRNILAMAEKAFPGVKFTLKKQNGWGADWELSWEDGPTEKEFFAATDLNLFATYHDRFNGMEDLAYTTSEEHTDFACKYMGPNSRDIKIERIFSDSKKSEVLSTIIAACPACDSRSSYGYFQDVQLTEEQARAISSALNADFFELFKSGCGRFDLDYVNAARVARMYWYDKSFYVASDSKKNPV